MLDVWLCQTTTCGRQKRKLAKYQDLARKLRKLNDILAKAYLKGYQNSTTKIVLIKN